MNSSELLASYLLEPASEELVDKLIELQSATVTEGDSAVYFDVALALFDVYSNLQDFDSAIEVLKNAINSELTEDYKIILTMIDKMISLLIRTEDFHELDGILKMRERYITGDKHQLMMQSFYMAVGFEGLKKYREAIDVLDNIPDNMSSNNIISKYLKLSMLSMRIGNVEKARTHFEKAILFDRFKKNPLFALVESDLLFAEKDYLKSLEKYQEYFIKTKIKNRYLDRYLLLCVQLERYDEALKFYRDYEPKIRSTLSKNYQKTFYEASLSLFEHLYSPGDYEYVRDRVNELRNETIEIVNQFDGIYSLLSKYMLKTDITSERDYLLHASRAFHELVNVERFHFVYIDDDGYHVMTHHKNLLMEKKYSYNQIQGTIIDKIYAEVLPLHVIHQSDLVDTLDFINHGPVSSEIILASKTSSEYYGNMYLLAFLNQANHYDYIHKLVLVLSRLIESSLSQLYCDKMELELIQIRDHFEQVVGAGLLRIENGVVSTLNQQANEMLGISESHFKYEILRDRFIQPKPYLDDFLKHPEWIIQFESLKGQKKTLKILVKEIKMVLYLYVIDLTEESISLEDTMQLLNHDIDSNLETIQSLKKAFDSHTQASSLVYFDLQDRDQLFERYYFDLKIRLNSSMNQILTDIGKGSFIGLYRSYEGGWFLYLNTVDKRVINRIWNELSKSLNQKALLLEPINLKGICAVIQKKRSFEELLTELFEQYYRGLDESGLAYMDRRLASERHLMATIQLNLDKILSEKDVPISFHPVCKWSDTHVLGYMIDIHSRVLLGEKQLLEDAIRIGLLSKRFDTLLYRSFLRNLIHSKASDQLLYFFNLHEQTIHDETALDDFMKRIKKSDSVELSQIVLIIPNESLPSNVLLDRIVSLKSKGFQLALKNFSKISLSDYQVIESVDILIVEKNDIQHLSNLKNKKQFILIYHHQDETLKKSVLTDNGVDYVFGSLFPAQDNPVNDLLHNNKDRIQN